eukprot:jgi/Chlat1/5427/Chrsp35S05320
MATAVAVAAAGGGGGGGGAREAARQAGRDLLQEFRARRALAVSLAAAATAASAEEREPHKTKQEVVEGAEVKEKEKEKEKDDLLATWRRARASSSSRRSIVSAPRHEEQPGLLLRRPHAVVGLLLPLAEADDNKDAPPSPAAVVSPLPPLPSTAAASSSSSSSRRGRRSLGVQCEPTPQQEEAAAAARLPHVEGCLGSQEGVTLIRPERTVREAGTSTITQEEEGSMDQQPRTPRVGAQDERDVQQLVSKLVDLTVVEALFDDAVEASCLSPHNTNKSSHVTREAPAGSEPCPLLGYSGHPQIAVDNKATPSQACQAESDSEDDDEFEKDELVQMLRTRVEWYRGQLRESSPPHAQPRLVC